MEEATNMPQGTVCVYACIENTSDVTRCWPRQLTTPDQGLCKHRSVPHFLFSFPSTISSNQFLQRPSRNKLLGRALTVQRQSKCLLVCVIHPVVPTFPAHGYHTTGAYWGLQGAYWGTTEVPCHYLAH